MSATTRAEFDVISIGNIPSIDDVKYIEVFFVITPSCQISLTRKHYLACTELVKNRLDIRVQHPLGITNALVKNPFSNKNSLFFYFEIFIRIYFQLMIRCKSMRFAPSP